MGQIRLVVSDTNARANDVKKAIFLAFGKGNVEILKVYGDELGQAVFLLDVNNLRDYVFIEIYDILGNISRISGVRRDNLAIG